MRRLLIANTYYQLVVCMQIRETIFKNDDMIKVGCIISDLIKGSADKENLKVRVRELCIKHPLPYQQPVLA